MDAVLSVLLLEEDDDDEDDDDDGVAGRLNVDGSVNDGVVDVADFVADSAPSVNDAGALSPLGCCNNGFGSSCFVDFCFFFEAFSNSSMTLFAALLCSSSSSSSSSSFSCAGFFLF